MMYRSLAVGAAALAAGVLLAATPLAATPVREGLVLWLDAGDASTITVGEGGRVDRWTGKLEGQGTAVPPAAERRPRYVPDAMGGQPAIRFHQGEHLRLTGTGSALDFRPGDEYTVLVAYRHAANQFGTLLAKGGGEASRRSYQFYVTPANLGAIAFGAMHEVPNAPGENIAAFVCDGSTVEVHAAGEQVLEFEAGQGVSDVDVLIGARREHDDNSGTFYPFSGDIAEILVYRRALDAGEHAAVGRYLSEKYGLITAYLEGDAADRLLTALREPGWEARAERLVANLARVEEDGAAALEALLAQEPAAALDVAELLVRASEQNRLSDTLAALAGRLLESDDHFVRSLAEWAIAMKVGGENNGQTAVWPKPAGPAWYAAWANLDGDFLLTADWVRQATTAEIHRDPAGLADSVAAMIARAERMVHDHGAAETPPQLATLQSLHDAMMAIVVEEAAAEEAAAAQPADAGPLRLAAVQRHWLEAREVLREFVFAQAPIDFDELVFIRRFAPHTVANITRAYAWRYKPGGDIVVLSGIHPGGAVRDLIDGRLGPGHVRGMDLWWEADRLVFSYARQGDWPPHVDTTDSVVEGTHVWELRNRHEPLQIYEVGTDGSRLRQRTDHPYWNDFEPTWTAAGDVVFSSDRAGRSQQCGAFDYDHSSFNLYRLTPEGVIHPLTDSKDTDRYPHSLDNGLIAFTRWEYQERHFMEVHSIWTARPDGTLADALFKQHMPAPLGLRDVRSIPGSNDLVAIAAGHHTYAFGPVVTVSPRYGLNNEEGLMIVTPGVRPQEGPMGGRPVAEGGVADRGGLYEAPWALSERAFLAAYAYARPNCTSLCGADSNGFAIYYFDSYGNKELVFRDLLMSCTMPIPLQERPQPAVFPEATDPQAAYATLFVADVYAGMPEVPRGSVKSLRIAQRVGWPYTPEHGQMTYISGNAWQDQFGFWSWAPVRVIGDVPVEDHGSAHFRVPANTAVYFQALDERGMEVRRMRSMVSAQAGETRGCVGCHESRAVAGVSQATRLTALSRPANLPAAPPWGAERLLGYEWLVQPIFNRHCVACHGPDEPAGGIDLTDHRADDGFVQSFRTLFGREVAGEESAPRLVSVSDRFSDSSVTQPMAFGSHRSRLIDVLLDDERHADEVQLSAEEWSALVTWIDANAPYFDTFYNRRPADGGPPRREAVAIPLPAPFGSAPAKPPCGTADGDLAGEPASSGH